MRRRKPKTMAKKTGTDDKMVVVEEPTYSGTGTTMVAGNEGDLFLMEPIL